ncbi:MAG: hypothetical protein CFH19_00849 [Alphaproteobacteria bacterium MarineAlpha5_Bin9]|nr:MAG: hypothetical protein CFH19_00849 [Alphaproteobacteria bacterium MarineAlpha5_Bin9]|tara:strand:- start:4819 stop:5877 length:1059 start_codon:yes stop_codon:yes gene_type:complete
MKLFIILIFVLISPINLNGFEFFTSKYYHYNIETFNADLTKKNLIKVSTDKTIESFLNKFLDTNNRLKFNNIFNRKYKSEELIKSINIENEFIRENKYIADIKINLNIRKIINIFRNEKINYTFLNSKPFLVISTYNFGFNSYGLNQKNKFNSIFKDKITRNDLLIKFNFPNLDFNDRYILPLEKIKIFDINSFNRILDKYKLKNLIYFQIEKSANLENYQINIFTYSLENNLKKIVSLDSINTKNLDSFFNHSTNLTINYLDDWWKKNNNINNKIINSKICIIKANNYNDLLTIRNSISSISELKSINIKELSFNSNLIIINYYGDERIFKQNLIMKNLLFEFNDKCIIYK